MVLSSDWIYHSKQKILELVFLNSSTSKGLDLTTQRWQALVWLNVSMADRQLFSDVVGANDSPVIHVDCGVSEHDNKLVWITFGLNPTSIKPSTTYEESEIRAGIIFPLGTPKSVELLYAYDTHVEPIQQLLADKYYDNLVYTYMVNYDGNNRNYTLHIFMWPKDANNIVLPNIKNHRIKLRIITSPDTRNKEDAFYHPSSDNIQQFIESSPQYVSFLSKESLGSQKVVKYSIEILNQEINVVAVSLYIHGEQIRHVKSLPHVFQTTVDDKKEKWGGLDVPISSDVVYVPQDSSVEIYLVNSSMQKSLDLKNKTFTTTFYVSKEDAYKNISISQLSQNVTVTREIIQDLDSCTVHVLEYTTVGDFTVPQCPKIGSLSAEVVTFGVHGYSRTTDPFQRVETRYSQSNKIIPIPDAPTISHFEGLAFKWSYVENVLKIWLIQTKDPLVEFLKFWIKLNVLTAERKTLTVKHRSTECKLFQQLGNNILIFKPLERFNAVGDEIVLSFDVSPQPPDFTIHYLIMRIVGQRLKEIV